MESKKYNSEIEPNGSAQQTMTTVTAKELRNQPNPRSFSPALR